MGERHESAAQGVGMPHHGKHATTSKRLAARLAAWRHRAYEIIEHGPVGDRAMRIVSRLLILLVLINIVAVVLESVPHYEAAYGGLFVAVEMVSLVVFTVESVL